MQNTQGTIIPDIITLLKSHTFYGAGEFTEIAKGKNEYVDNLQTGINKIKRIWHSRRK
jgi:hypothetical protein